LCLFLDIVKSSSSQNAILQGGPLQGGQTTLRKVTDSF
jgi:hypothetical protein